MPNKISNWIAIISFALLISACSSSDGGRYTMANDQAPSSAPDVTKVENAHPKYEAYSRGGNKKNYTVLGKSYQVMDTGKGYRSSGTASWYGSKFHGHLTSNGETYDMYSMSAAHKSLPLPSYVKVTNLANNKEVIVRVNDRGPFHEDRIIDLSYAAAHKLDMLKTGTAKVAIEAIYIENPESIALAELKETKLHYIQVLASSNKAKVNTLAKRLEDKYQVKTRLKQSNNLYKLQLGPIGRQQLATKLNQELKSNGFPQSYLISE
ncbi:septal ring lytic transglycosylase RlpA family protein [Shewanella sp. D64]|uniref:septal ring lytic transglycosylase RlpA family protein n=1 Tax=unclassified Shewanella TaxID=196818 RepID=UPI0022BA3D4D|nr:MULTISPECIES: septal ring lytic transglycosylase RlpA family protein [unclassified Shewanella]MEC4728715.1 septal ring lytic transglycosylase RlpA family protein [Shewanella sp. D64]MEC4740343.1 septal ring lytic transglycosylase RlpA family protein [Shewanella sp. E94]WBJ98252.1 septal ring lytic transglycosylase RlpA family protein [Shewanella sp. MTB7]